MKRPTKAELRAQLAQHTQAYLNQGGVVSEVNSGATGLIDGAYNTRNFNFDEPRKERTPLTNVMATMDARRTRKKAPAKIERTRSRKKVIYDDFGEPLRVVWVEE